MGTVGEFNTVGVAEGALFRVFVAEGVAVKVKRTVAVGVFVTATVD